MKKILSVLLVVFLLFTGSALADNFKLGSESGVSTYAGIYVGPVESRLNGVLIEGGAMCIEAPKTSYFNTNWNVNVSTVDPVNLVNSRLGDAGLSLYQEAGFLMGQIPTHKTEVGEINFAIYRLIDPDYINTHFTSAGRNIPLEDSWMLAAKSINPLELDFTDVKIYTALDNKNQELMSGGASAVPIPSGFILLSGSLAMFLLGKRQKKC